MVPVAYGASVFGPGGTQTAEGCSGGAPGVQAGVTSLALPYEATGVIGVGRDGFFTLRIVGEAVSEDEALESVTVEVRDSAGDAVPGSTTKLSSSADGDFVTVVAGWEADGPLVEGERYEVRALGERGDDDAVTSEITIEVKDEEAELVAPEPTLGSFFQLTRDTGSELTCVGETTCGEFEAKVGKEVEHVPAASLEFEFPEAPVVVAWSFTTESVPNKGTLVAGQTWDTVNHRLAAGDVAFRGQSEEYCVRVVARDLRTDEVRSGEVCGTPGSGLEAVNRDRVGDCVTPPAGLEERWCEFHPTLPECEEDEPGPGGAGGGPGGAPPVIVPPPAGAGGEGGEEPEFNDGDSNKKASKGSSSCSVADPGASQRADLALFGGLALALTLVVRRRRATRR